MRVGLMIAGVLAATVATAGLVGFVRYQQAFPAPSSETVQLTPAKRAVLRRLRAEAKFSPNDFPPLGYTGPPTPEDRAVATAAVDGLLDDVLARPDGPIEAKTVIRAIASATRKVGGLETEDRDRAADYMLETWYVLGFRGATGRFAHGAAYRTPPGYMEPLPAGWKSPTEPRPIG